VVTNDDLARVLDTTGTWIRSRTGIEQRHVASPGMTTADLAVEAGLRALKSSGTGTADALILATTTPDRRCPATAPEVAARLGLGQAAAFDVSAVCSGFIYALAAAAGLIAAGTAGRVLVIGAETFTRLLDPADRTTRAIFGDGAGAVVLRAGDAGEPGALGPFWLGSDGSGASLITVPDGGYFQMQGQPVYRRAIETMATSTARVLELAGLEVADIDWLVCHQANRRILAAVATRLGLPERACLSNIDTVGNTAAASIPLALADAAAGGALRAGDLVVLTAFGGGLTWGSALLRWAQIECGR
jgi:3-oxoacyl-[acyl-carrier-protein] synthase-3